MKTKYLDINNYSILDYPNYYNSKLGLSDQSNQILNQSENINNFTIQ